MEELEKLEQELKALGFEEVYTDDNLYFNIENFVHCIKYEESGYYSIWFAMDYTRDGVYIARSKDKNKILEVLRAIKKCEE